MNAQTSIDFELAETAVSSQVEMVKVLLSRGIWMTPWEVCEEVWRTRGIRMSDSSATARTRDLRKQAYGAHTVLIRRRSGSKAYEYKLEDRR